MNSSYLPSATFDKAVTVDMLSSLHFLHLTCTYTVIHPSCICLVALHAISFSFPTILPYFYAAENTDIKYTNVVGEIHADIQQNMTRTTFQLVPTLIFITKHKTSNVIIYELCNLNMERSYCCVRIKIFKFAVKISTTCRSFLSKFDTLYLYSVNIR